MNDDARPACGPGFDFERDLEHLFEQFALIHGSRRAYPKAFAPVQQNDLIGEFRRQAQIVSDLNDGVTMLVGQVAETAKQVDLRPDVEMQCGFIK